jgi:hypothetical protein
VPLNFNIFQISCTHWGSKFHHHGGWRNLIEMMNKPYGGIPASANYLIHHGDAIEAIEISDKRWSLQGCEPGGVIPQLDNCVEMLEPIKKKIITLLQGNHEQHLEARYGNITSWVSKELEVPYGTYTAVITYVSKKDGSLLFKQFATHGFGMIHSSADDIKRRNSNRELSLKRKLKNKLGDAFLMTMGHTHQLIVSKPEAELYIYSTEDALKQMYTYTAPNAPFIPPDLRWYLNIGAFFKMYSNDLINHDHKKPTEGVRSSYAERAGYDPIELGFAVVMVRDGVIADIRREVMD